MPKFLSTPALVLSALSAALIWVPSGASADPIVSLGTAASFAVLAGTTVTNSGASIIDGNLGVWPGTAITGFGPSSGLLGPGIVNGTQYAGGTATDPSGTAEGDLTTAYNDLAGLACGTTLTGDLGGMTLLPGVYCFTSNAQLTGTLTLNEDNETNAEFVFQIASSLNTATDAAVTEINGGADDNIFWQVGSSATLGTDTDFVGNIVALTSISLDVGDTITCGAALARNGSVTLLDNAITLADSSTCASDVSSFTPNPASVPEPSTLMGFGTALFALIGIGSRRRRLA